MAYRIEMAREARAVYDTLPPAGRDAVDAAKAQLSRDPWGAGKQKGKVRQEREMFITGGWVLYFVVESRSPVSITTIFYAG